MPYFAPPAKTEISAIPSPTNAAHNAGLGKLWDMITGLFGNTGEPAGAFEAMKLKDPKALYNLQVIFSVNANALTITVAGNFNNTLSSGNPGHVAQREEVILYNGSSLRKLEANVSLVISAGSTLGHVANFLLPIYVYLIDNSGVQEPAASRSFFGESGKVSTSAEGGAGGADSATTMYSTVARANLSFRLIAIAWFNQAVAGNWVNMPTESKPAPFLLEKVGEIVDYGGGTVEYGFHLQDGANVLRAGDNAKLFGKVGTNFGAGDGSTTFGVGDSRRRVPVGSGGTGTGTLGNAVGNVGGAETHTLLVTESAVHGHIQGMPGGAGITYAYGSTTGTSTGRNDASGVGTDYPNTSNAGGGAAHNNMQPSMVVTRMIRWLGDI